MPTSHRLTLTAAELALLAAETGVDLPPGFVTPSLRTTSEPVAGTGEWLTGAESAEVGLRRRGLVDGAGTPIAAVAANLAVLSAPQVTVRTVVTLPGSTRQALHALSGGLAAGLLHSEGDEVELSLFPAWEFGAELARAVPPPVLPPATADVTAARLAAAPGHSHARLASGRSGGAAVGPSGGGAVGFAESGGGPSGGATVGFAQADAVGGHYGGDVPGDLAESANALVRQLNGQVFGILRAVVHSDEGALLGGLVWAATDAGWVGVRGPGVATPEVVRAADLASWLEPCLAAAFDATR